MDEKVKNDEKKVMLVRQTGEGQDGKLKAVGSIDEDGNIKTLDPTAANVAKLFDVHTNQPALEAFFTKFMEQSQDPVKTGISEIFIMAESVLENYLDAARRAHLETVTIIHGKGTGALRKAVQAYLRRDKTVKSFRLGNYGEGESGVTVVEFK